jgi:2-keto-4-pentenoate hydratase/2-oxohepta-3-ene-1,7-dioic acid hydratase in catechol pathway
MIFDTKTLVYEIARAITLMPGDIILTGTPAGVGFVRKPPVFLKDGDTCEIEIEKIGILSNPVKNEK